MKWKSLSRVQLFSTPRSIQSMEFSQPEYWSGQPFPSSGDLPNPGVKPRSPPLQVDSFPAEPQGSPRILEWVAYPFFSESSQLGKQTRVFCIAGRFFTNWAMREAQLDFGCILKREELSTYWQVVLWGLRLWHKQLVAPLTEKRMIPKWMWGRGWGLSVCWWNIHMYIGVKCLNTLDRSPLKI